MITEERKAELESAGYYIEDMGDVHGPDFAGQYRWMHTQSDAFQDWGTSYSPEDAWGYADRHQQGL